MNIKKQTPIYNYLWKNHKHKLNTNEQSNISEELKSQQKMNFLRSHLFENKEFNNLFNEEKELIKSTLNKIVINITTNNGSENKLYPNKIKGYLTHYPSTEPIVENRANITLKEFVLKYPKEFFLKKPKKGCHVNISNKHFRKFKDTFKLAGKTYEKPDYSIAPPQTINGTKFLIDRREIEIKTKFTTDTFYENIDQIYGEFEGFENDYGIIDVYFVTLHFPYENLTLNYPELDKLLYQIYQNDKSSYGVMSGFALPIYYENGCIYFDDDIEMNNLRKYRF